MVFEVILKVRYVSPYLLSTITIPGMYGKLNSYFRSLLLRLSGDLESGWGGGIVPQLVRELI